MVARMKRCCVVVVIGLLGSMVGALGCGSHAEGNIDDKEMVPQCVSYIQALNRCQLGARPDVISQRAAGARKSFLVAAKDQAARDKLAAQCSAAEQRISRACR